MKSYQPYWIAFAHANHTTPEQLEPGVKTNYRYMVWIQQQWDALYALHPELFQAETRRGASRPSAREGAHAVLADYLAARFPAPEPVSAKYATVRG